uniref:NADH dehydrogenase subunit 6 n=1 Tax=Neohydnus jiuzhaigouensis TaxID=3028310 RepID=UPI0023D83B2A|nr:NADH dehydrogenase subunit 6 [Neohydnus jiuzhaigouensis]WDE20723.1 NADH dehydrogenase subunit 6 [Neohydnus jiuzhaigouensis]
MTFLMILSMFTSLSSLFLSHPMSLGMILMTQTIISSLIINFLNFNFWFSYILFLVMIGGMLILFTYMTSVASNEKFMFNNKLIILFIIWMIFIMFSFMIDSSFMDVIFNNNEILKMNSNMMFNMSMNKYFNFPNLSIFYITIIYLLITLIAVVKITNFNMGPLRHKN